MTWTQMLRILNAVQFFEAHSFGKNAFPTNQNLCSVILEVQIYEFGIVVCSPIMEFDLTWVQMARYELKLRLDGALYGSGSFSNPS